MQPPQTGASRARVSSGTSPKTLQRSLPENRRVGTGCDETPARDAHDVGVVRSPHDGGDRGPRWVNGYASSMRLPPGPGPDGAPPLPPPDPRAPPPAWLLPRPLPGAPRPRDHLPTRPSPRRTSSPGIPSSPGPSPPRATTDPRRRPSTMRADSSCGTATATASPGWRGWRRRRRRRTPGRRRGLGRGQFRRDRGISLRARRGVARAFRQDGGDAPRARARASSRGSPPRASEGSRRRRRRGEGRRHPRRQTRGGTRRRLGTIGTIGIRSRATVRRGGRRGDPRAGGEIKRAPRRFA